MKPTIPNLRHIIKQAGGDMEEDASSRDDRIFQAVAPYGKLWRGSDLKCLLIQWPVGEKVEQQRGREWTFADVADRVEAGLRDMTPEEREQYEEPIKS